MSVIFRTRNQLSRVSKNFIYRHLLSSRNVQDIHDIAEHSASEEAAEDNLGQSLIHSENGKVEERGYTAPKEDDKNESRSRDIALQKHRWVDNAVEKHIGENDLDFIDDDNYKPPGPLDDCTEDISYIGPEITPTFTFAKYANRNRTIQELINIGVNLYEIQKKPGVVKLILERDFEKDIKPYIQFLHNCGIPASQLGSFFTNCPYILREDMDDLNTRIKYLLAHKFDNDMIKTILSCNARWLTYSIKDIDKNLGYFQTTFHLTGNEVRRFAVSFPRVITWKGVERITFCVKEEMGFERDEMKSLLLKQGNIWTYNHNRLINTWIYVHEIMELPHSLISKDPLILTYSKDKIECRHKFLKTLKKAQFDPTKPLYVSLSALVKGSDEEFCENIAKASIETYDWFLKTF